MSRFIALLGICYIILGIAGFVATKRTHLALCNLMKNARRQSLGPIVLICGALLLISASAAKEPWFVLALGIFACLKGALIILMPEKNLKATVDWWSAAPEIVYKLCSVAALTLGIILFNIR